MLRSKESLDPLEPCTFSNKVEREVWGSRIVQSTLPDICVLSRGWRALKTG